MYFQGFPESELREVFSKFGSVGEIFTISNNRNSLGKYVSCFVRMNRTADARRAIEGLNGKTALKGSSKLHSFRVEFHIFLTRFECNFTSSQLVSSVFF